MIDPEAWTMRRLNSRNWKTVKTQSLVRWSITYASRIPLTIGFHRRTAQTRKFKAERGFMSCCCVLSATKCQIPAMRCEMQSKIFK